ncbi:MULTISPECIES: SH3 domain-containing protein [unclassified Streptomyces]|uniref:SH3 domain-containing protein n=1 Tax=unclassified Streptomyces TaxID=2593676 RepID=UPI002DD7DCD1|nr:MULTISPECIES: SH3 domain-containing protein [unclassified Streptomyces]WSA94274.1 SH3 domain-containing protein [Streptomyces sp. NBC_01795]WSB78691.1 SH3 domain-containing protein [Streptomyces sp. NBC_01775]WSS13104.1 SH3 domain-containing protein [Streptomyces sp. NBC_01186]WSS41888.1 SH3 domain-containing protein [Streptomyces sp. NBC_01187]
MSKFTGKALAVAGAGIALAAVLSPVAHAEGHAPVAKAGLTELQAFEPAPVYKGASSSSERAGTVQRGETVKVFCYLHTSGGNWYSIQDVGGALWTHSSHYSSSGAIKKC